MLTSLEFHRHTLQKRKYGPAVAGVLDGVGSWAATTDNVFWHMGHWKQLRAHLYPNVSNLCLFFGCHPSLPILFTLDARCGDLFL